MHQRVTCFFAVLLVCLLASNSPAGSAPPVDEIREALRSHLPTILNTEMLLALDARNLEDGLRRIDPHARLFSPGQYQSPALPGQELAGIGAELFFSQGRAYLTPYQGGAMARAGLMERMELTGVDGFSVRGAVPEMVVQRLQGKAGTRVDLSLATLSENKPIQVRLRREAFQPLSVELLQQESQAVFRVREFKAGMTRTALRASIEFIGPGIRPIFIDLRESTGGDIYEAFDCSALFLPEGDIMGGLRLHGRDDQVFPSPTGRKFDGPVVLLIGPDTASAAEAFAAALAHHGQAILVGRPTLGKCSTQTDVRLSEGWTLRLTNGLVLGPDGQSCDGTGLRPDILVEPDALFDLTGLVQRGKQATLDTPTKEKRTDANRLHQLEQEGRLTVRALRAWNRLPTRYVRLVLDLLAHDLDLLGADISQVRAWTLEATDGDGRLTDYANELGSLLEYMDQRLWAVEGDMS